MEEIDTKALQGRIDAINWYHDFDFPNGLQARTETPDKKFHRMLWKFMQRTLDQIDFEGKSVLDIGCWDGYWSFYAERRGARSVLATDDISQNWAEGTGLPLAKELLNSSININQQLSVYNVASLGQKFDVVLCMGVFYHLYDPYYAFSQIRHCCHEDSIVVFEGDVSHKLKPYTAEYRFDDESLQTFVPSPDYLRIALEANYFELIGTEFLLQNNFIRKLKNIAKAMLGQQSGLNRVIVTCKPFRGENRQQPYFPCFGVHKFDPRYHDR